MRFIITAAAAVIIATCVSADEQTLFPGGAITHGGFGAPVVKVSSVMDETALFVGGRGGWIINHQFVLGGGGYGLVTSPDASDEAAAFYGDDDIVLDLGYGGLELEYIGESDRVVHYTLYALVGGGGVTYRDRDDHDVSDEYDTDSFFVFEPAVNAEINITTWFRLNAGLSYRLVSGAKLHDISDSDLDGLTGSLTLKFGSF